MSGAAVVIGSGPNGLSAAIALARGGRDVTVLEEQEHVGGAVHTEEMTLPGFLHDTWSSVYPAAANSTVFEQMPLSDHGLRWIHPRYCLAHVLEGGRSAVLARSVDETAASLNALHPGDGEGWRRFAGPYMDSIEAVRHTMLAGFPPVTGPLRLLAGMGVDGLLEFTRLLLAPAEALGLELFESDDSRAWLYGTGSHSEMPPTMSGSAIACAYLHLLGHRGGWPSPEGGAGRLSEALASYARSLGVTIRTGVHVTRVRVARGRAAGVETADGGALAAPLVIADVLPGQLLALAGDALGGEYARRLRRYRPGPATLKIDWALSGPTPWSAPDAREAGTVHIGGDAEEVIAATDFLRDGRLPDPPFMLFGQQTIADPTRAPAGQHTAWAYAHAARDADWQSRSDGFVEAMESRIEHFAPGFRDRILARAVQRPPDLAARNRNLDGGDTGAGSYALDQLVFRPLPALSPYRTTVRGLYIGSAATFPGGAVHGVCGDAAARVALLEARLRRF